MHKEQDETNQFKLVTEMAGLEVKCFLLYNHLEALEVRKKV